MKIVYVDETGDPSGHPATGGSREYALGVVVVDADSWKDAFDGLIELRRDIRRVHKIGVTREIKASALVRLDGPLKGMKLSSSQRQQIYRWHMRKLEAIGVKAFAVWVDKRTHTNLADVRETVWNMLFQRLERTYRGEPVVIIHDEGEEATIRKYARRARRYLTAGSLTGTGGFRVNFERLVDDPVSRRSHEALFIQCADLVAYAAAKAMIAGGARANRVCPPTMWNTLGTACLAAVNGQARRSNPALPPGIAVWT